jgi:hypothetical protein
MSIKLSEQNMTEGMRGRLIAQLTNLKKQNKKSVSLDIDYVLNALTEAPTMPVAVKRKPRKTDADAGYFKD